MQKVEERRELRLRIARLRRQVDRDLHAIRSQSRALASWRTYVERYPIPSVLASLGAGLMLSMGLRRGGLTRWIGKRLFQESFAAVTAGLARELRRLWTEWTSTSRTDCQSVQQTEGTGASHEQG